MGTVTVFTERLLSVMSVTLLSSHMHGRRHCHYPYGTCEAQRSDFPSVPEPGSGRNGIWTRSVPLHWLNVTLPVSMSPFLVLEALPVPLFWVKVYSSWFVWLLLSLVVKIMIIIEHYWVHCAMPGTQCPVVCHHALWERHHYSRFINEQTKVLWGEMTVSSLRWSGQEAACSHPSRFGGFYSPGVLLTALQLCLPV